MHGILRVNPTDPFQFHGLRRQHQEQVGSLLIVSSYTWPKGFKMSQMGMRRSTTRTKELVMCSFMMSLDLSTSPYFHVLSGLTLKRSNHCEVQMFCAPSHRPRHEPEGLTHGVVERCLRIRLMFLLWCFMWAAVNIRGSQDAISSIRSATIRQFGGIRTLYYCNTNDFDSCPCPCAFRRTPGNNFQDSIMYRHGNASFWRGTRSIVKFDESCSFTLQPQCVARSRHTCGSLWHRMIMNLERGILSAALTRSCN